MKRHLTFAALIASALMLSSAVGAIAQAGATDRPVQATATGYGYWPGVGAPGSLDCPGYVVGETTFAYLEGTMTHLGRVHVEMRHCTFYPDFGEFSTDTGIIDITAADGDVLRGTYETWIAGFDGERVTAGFTISFGGTGSSGRFAGAAGAADGEIVFTYLGYDVNVWPATSWNLEGNLTY